jgi:hypothetical protein
MPQYVDDKHTVNRIEGRTSGAANQGIYEESSTAKYSIGEKL